MEKLEQAKVVAATTKAAYLSSGGLGIISFFTLDQWALICAMVIGVLTFIVNLIFKIREDRRGKKLLDLQQKRMHLSRDRKDIHSV